MALFTPATGIATVAANTKSITIAGCDITPLAAGMVIHLGSRGSRLGTGYVINTVTPNSTTGGTLTTIDDVASPYTNAPFLVDMGAGLSATPTGYATFVLARILTYLTSFLGIGTNLDGASKDIALDRGNGGIGTFARLKASIAGRIWFGIEQRTVGGTERWAHRAYPDGTTPVDALTIRGDTGTVDFLSSSTDLAAATTTDIGALDTRKVNITGAGTIVSFGSGAHKERLLRFTGASTLTHNATTLVLPGAANLTMAAGDMAFATSDVSGNWTVRQVTRAARSVDNMGSSTVTLLTNAAATGPWTAWSGGTAAWSVSGTFAGATAQLQGSPDGGAAWGDVTGAGTTANTTIMQFIVDLPATYTYRVALTGGTGTPSLTSTLKTLDRV